MCVGEHLLFKPCIVNENCVTCFSFVCNYTLCAAIVWGLTKKRDEKNRSEYDEIDAEGIKCFRIEEEKKYNNGMYEQINKNVHFSIYNFLELNKETIVFCKMLGKMKIMPYLSSFEMAVRKRCWMER